MYSMSLTKLLLLMLGALKRADQAVSPSKCVKCQRHKVKLSVTLCRLFLFNYSCQSETFPDVFCFFHPSHSSKMSTLPGSQCSFGENVLLSHSCCCFIFWPVMVVLFFHQPLQCCYLRLQCFDCRTQFSYFFVVFCIVFPNNKCRSGNVAGCNCDIALFLPTQ